MDNTPASGAMKMYVMVDKSLPPIHAGIQSLHSSVELVYNHISNPKVSEWASTHKTVVLIGADNTEMVLMMNYFTTLGKVYSSFREPDLDNLLTAIAFEPLTELEAETIFPKDKFRLYR
jgi:hypothetical protein